MKFLPTYLLSVETVLGGAKGGSPANVEIKPPLAIDFEIRRATLSSAQTASFTVYDLKETSRDLVQKDWFNLSDVRAVQFSAGYRDTPLTMIFNGTIKQAQSVKRPGAVDFHTVIEAFDGGPAMANGFSLRTIPAGSQFSDIIKALAADLPNLARSAIIGKIDGATSRGASFAGNTWNYIFQLSNGLAFIDNGQLKILNPNEYAGTEVPVISSDSGLLGTPERYLNMLRCPLLFEPRFTLGQLVELKSSGLKRFNGLYKVVGLTHRGNISQVRDGERRTELTLWNGLGNADSWTPVAEVPLQ